MAASSWGGYDHDVATEHIEDVDASSQCIMFAVISFNFGIEEDMFNTRAWGKKHAKKFVQLMDTFIDEYCADAVFGCEVGGHKSQKCARILDNLGLTNLQVTCRQNYMTALNLKNLTTKLLGEPEVMRLASTWAIDVQLVLTAVDTMQGTKQAAITVVGNLHTRTPSGKRPPTMCMRQRLVREAIGKIEDYANRIQEKCLLLSGMRQCSCWSETPT